MAKTTFGIPFNPIFGSVSFPGGGNIRGTSGALTFNAGGVNQNVTLAPTGTGFFDLRGMLQMTTVNAPSSSVTALITIGRSPGGQVEVRYHNGVNGFYFVNNTGVQQAWIAVNSLNYFKDTLLLGTVTDSSNGRLQLTTHTTSAGGIAWGTSANEVMFRTGSDACTIGFTAVTFGGTITTAAPTVGAAAAWNLGTYTADLITTQTGVVRVNIAGVSYKLLAST